MKVIRTFLPLVLTFILLLSILPAGAIPLGDLNGDAAVTSADAVHLLYHTTLPEQYPLYQPADYTQDGTTDATDAVYLLYHALLPHLYPLSVGINLPELGYDPDGKGRISLTALALQDNTVTATFTNASRTWVTEETSTISYVCKNEDGITLSSGSFYLGYVRCGASVTDTITLPKGAATLTFTGGNISYWSQWMQ